MDQFSVATIDQQMVVILTNTLFHDIDTLLVAVVKPLEHRELHTISKCQKLCSLGRFNTETTFNKREK